MTVTTKTIIQNGQASENHLTKRERDRLHRTFTYDGYVKSFARWAAFYGFLIGGGVGAVAIYFAAAKMAVVMSGGLLFVFSFLLALAMSGLLGTVALWHRGDEFRELMAEYELDEYSLPLYAPLQIDDRAVPTNGKPMALERQAKTVEYAKQQFTFTGKQLDSMKEWVRAGHVKVRRDPSPEGPNMASIGIKSADYSRATMVLKGRGLIDEQYQWTAKGINWLENE